jgi:hypothetical protein
MLAGATGLAGAATKLDGFIESFTRAQAATNVRNARNVLRDARADLTATERNQIIKAFDLQTLKVQKLNSTLTEYRYYDGVGAQMGGRWSTPQWLVTPEERISQLALPNNQATKAAIVELQPGTVVFQGRVAPQLNFGSNLLGGGAQSFNVSGPRAVIREYP